MDQRQKWDKGSETKTHCISNQTSTDVKYRVVCTGTNILVSLGTHKIRFQKVGSMALIYRPANPVLEFK